MAHIVTFQQALDAIWQRSGYDRGFISNPFAGDESARLGLQRTQAMLDRLGDPDDAYPIVHVAGSKGKGSTCMFIDAILRASGLSCGRFLSPHLHSYLERFVVNDNPISEQDFTTLTADVMRAAEAFEAAAPELGQATAWELSTAMALLWFQRSACDVAVIEVGMGGTLDATNVVDPAVSVITQLDYEHTAILGTTMTEIAGNKAGIIKSGRPVVCAEQPPDGQWVIEKQATEEHAPLLVAGRDWTITGSDRAFSTVGPWGALVDLHLSLPGDHQVQNAALAIAAVNTLVTARPDLFTADNDAIRSGLQTTRHPARFERVTLDSGKTVIIDGAHSPSSTAALAATMRTEYPESQVTIIVGMLDDKDPAAVLAPLRGIASRWIAVTPESPRALPGEIIKAALQQRGAPCVTRPSTGAGLDTAIASGDPVILITGSFTTAAEARIALNLA